MAEEVTKYVSRIVFDSKDAMRKLAEYQKKMNTFQRNQNNMNRLGNLGGNAGGGLGSSNKASKTKLADMLRQEQIAENARNKQKEFNNRLELKHLSEQERAKITAQKKQAQLQERAARDNIRQKNFNNRLELKNAAALERTKDTLNRSVWFQKQYNTAAEKAIMNRLREQVLAAKTAKQVKDASANARRDLRTQREKLRAYEQQNFIMKRMQASSQQMAGNMVSAFAIAAAGAGIVRIGQQFESVNNTMLAVSTNAQEAGQNFQFVRDESYRLGLSLSESGKNFAKMVSARGEMSLQDTKAAFTGIAEMSTLLGLSSAESTRAINALQQIDYCLPL